MRILLVEDDLLLGDGVEAGLRQTGFTVDWIKDGVSARSALEVVDYDGMVLDINLPRLSGLDLLSEIRRAGNALPVCCCSPPAIRWKTASWGWTPGRMIIWSSRLPWASWWRVCAPVVRRAHGRASPTLEYAGLSLDPGAQGVLSGAGHRADR